LAEPFYAHRDDFESDDAVERAIRDLDDGGLPALPRAFRPADPCRPGLLSAGDGLMGAGLSVARQFGENLRRERKRLDLSQEEGGFRASVHRTEVGLLERGLACSVSTR
jgi:hypothetical protein